MLLTSIEFWAVLAAGFAGYWLTPRRIRPGVLALISFGYVVTLAPQSVLILTAMATACFHLAPRTQGSGAHRRALLLALVATPLALLLGFKYVPPLLRALTEGPSHEDVLIPLGISFYTFRLIHYVSKFRGDPSRTARGRTSFAMCSSSRSSRRVQSSVSIIF